MNMLLMFFIAQTISTLTGGDYIKAVQSGNYIFEVSQRGVTVINVENALEPFTELEIPTDGISLDLTVIGDYLYILDSQEGVIVYSLKDEEKKKTIKVKNATSIISIPPYIYVGRSDGYISIFEVKGENVKSKGELKLDLPISSVQIAPQGLYALLSDSVLAQIKFFKGGEIKLTNQFFFPEKITKYFAIDTLIIFGKRDGGLYLGKFSQPFIQVLKEIIPEDIITGLQVYGSQVYAGTEDGRLYLLRYPDFKVVSSAQLIGQINDFNAIGNILIVSVGRAGISVLKTPSLEEIKTIGGFGSLVSAGVMSKEVLYLLDPLLGVRFISFFSPFNPEKEKEVPLSGTFIRILKFKDNVLAAIREGGFWILSQKDVGVIKGFYPIEGKLNDIISVKDKIFVATDKGIIGLKYENGAFNFYFDINTEAKVFKLFNLGEKFGALQENGIFIYDLDGKIIEHKINITPILYSIRGSEIFICDIRGKIYKFEKTLANLNRIASLKPPVSDFVVGKNNFYVTDGSNKLKVYSITTGALKHEIDLPESIYFVDIKYPYIFLYGKRDRIFIYFVGKDVPEFTNSIRTKKIIRSLDFSEDGIFVGEKGYIETFRFYRFETPTEISYYLTYGELYRALPIRDAKILYIAGGSSGILGIDVSNIYSPKMFFEHRPQEGSTYDILRVGRFLITANLEGGIEVFELISEKNPKFFTRIKGDVLTIDVLENSFLLAGDRTGALRVFDLRGGVFSQISQLTEFDVPILDIETFNKIAYLALGDEGLAVIDMSIPHFPRIRKRINPGFPVYRLKVLGDRLFAICGAYGVIEYEIKENGDVSYLNHIDTPGNAQDVNKMGDYYLISDTYGLEIYKGG